MKNIKSYMKYFWEMYPFIFYTVFPVILYFIVDRDILFRLTGLTILVPYAIIWIWAGIENWVALVQKTEGKNKKHFRYKLQWMGYLALFYYVPLLKIQFDLELLSWKGIIIFIPLILNYSVLIFNSHEEEFEKDECHEDRENR